MTTKRFDELLFDELLAQEADFTAIIQRRSLLCVEIETTRRRIRLLQELLSEEGFSADEELILGQRSTCVARDDDKTKS